MVVCLLSLLTANVYACDFCNCYLGLNPQTKKNIIGLRYHYSAFTGTHLSDDEIRSLFLNKNKFTETHTTVELHGQWYPVQRLQVLFSIPYIYNVENVPSSSGGNAQARLTNIAHNVDPGTQQLSGSTHKGISDPVLLAHYQLFNRHATDSDSFAQRLMAGAGIKIPLGKYHLDPGSEVAERVHLPGTGSWDLLLSTVYMAKLNRLGLNVNVSYLLTTVNNESYEFGNRFNANMLLYYQLNAKEFSFFPNAGIFYESAAKNKSGSADIDNTGGHVFCAGGGLDIYYRKFALNMAAQIPVMLELNENQPHNDYRLSAGVSFAFN